MRYRTYIKSDAWMIRRQMALDLAGHRCQLCNTNKKTLHVHHRTYKRLGNEHPMDLTILCEDCHESFHVWEPKIQCYDATASGNESLAIKLADKALARMRSLWKRIEGTP